MKLGLVLLLSSLALGMDAFPEATFTGSGVKQFPDGKSKSYQISMRSHASQLDFRYEFPGIDPIDFSLQFTFEKNGFFKVGEIGSGYCGKNSCHWQVKLGVDDTEEWTLFFNENRLEKLGSRLHGGEKNYWEELLTRQ